jgi:hypothetical protein
MSGDSQEHRLYNKRCLRKIGKDGNLAGSFKKLLEAAQVRLPEVLPSTGRKVATRKKLTERRKRLFRIKCLDVDLLV